MSAFKSPELDKIKDRCREVGSCWQWISKAKCADRQAHPQMRTEKGGKPKLVRRVAYELRYGEFTEDRYLVPRCGSSFCVNPEHQWALTKLEKQKRGALIASSATGRATKISIGMRESGKTKLSMEIASQIREADGSLRAIGRQFGVSASVVGAIRRGELWRDHSSPMTGMFTQLLASNDSTGRRTA
jgi:hypothetical protein